MGLAASQVRFLQLTCRKSDIGRELEHLSNEKMALTRDMRAVSLEYQQALSSKVLKWSNNNGISYTNLNYSTLMRPSAANGNKPVLISDSSGKIVIDEKYKQYAEMISADGSAGGSWENNRTKILSALLGIPADQIDTAVANSNAMRDASDKRDDALADLNKWKAKEKTEVVDVDKLAKKLGTVNGQDLSKLYSKGENSSYPIKSVSDLQALADGIYNNLSKYFVDDEKYLYSTDNTALKEGCKAFVDSYTELMNQTGSNADKDRETYGLKGSAGNYTIDIEKALRTIMGGYVINGSYDYNSSNEKTFALRDTTSTEWQDWYKTLKEKQDAYDAAEAEFKTAVGVDGESLTADLEYKISFYDLMFNAIVDNGWTYDMGVEDDEYLSQMLQNNAYYITTMTENAEYDDTLPISSKNYKYDYSTDLASMYDNIYPVNDSDFRSEALVKYEYEKGIINAKESRIDTRMRNLETEQSSIDKMLDSIEKVENDNIENSFGLWA